MGKVIAAEIRLQGGHICYGPVLDIVRDPRWSRTEESYGEDCYLTARIGEAYVRGTGSGDLSQSRHALSTLKHFMPTAHRRAARTAEATCWANANCARPTCRRSKQP